MFERLASLDEIICSLKTPMKRNRNPKSPRLMPNLLVVSFLVCLNRGRNVVSEQSPDEFTAGFAVLVRSRAKALQPRAVSNRPSCEGRFGMTR